MNEVLLIYAVALLLAWPLGRYMAAIYSATPTASVRLFQPVEQLIYRGIGIQANLPMHLKQYGKSLLKLHVIIGVAALLIFMQQGRLPLNPDGIEGMSWDLALHTTASFITNTNQQHYSGQAQLSYLAHMFAIVSMQVITPTQASRCWWPSCVQPLPGARKTL